MTQESRIRIESALEQIAQAVEFVTDMAQRAGLNEQEIYHCQLVIDEACTNIIEHGYRFNGLYGSIDIICGIEPSRFTITVIDDSPPHNPLARPDPDPGASLEDRRVGGWGVYFIKKIMDQVSYFYEGRNRLVMMKRRDQAT